MKTVVEWIHSSIHWRWVLLHAPSALPQAGDPRTDSVGDGWAPGAALNAVVKRKNSVLCVEYRKLRPVTRSYCVMMHLKCASQYCCYGCALKATSVKVMETYFNVIAAVVCLTLLDWQCYSRYCRAQNGLWFSSGMPSAYHHSGNS
jgi:hypothetical protein